MNRPLICVPLLGASYMDLSEQYKMLDVSSFDMIEIRLDYYQHLHERDALDNFINKCGELKTNKPIIMTYRSIEEGGLGNLSEEKYIDLVKYLCTIDFIEYIDIEYSCSAFLELVNYCRKYKKILASKHYFKSTPPIEDNLNILTTMDNAGVDIAKISVMPQSNDDILSIFQLTNHGHKCCNCKIVVIGMGKLGVSTRLMAGQFGSYITFASGVASSAPGQISYLSTKRLIDEIYI